MAALQRMRRMQMHPRGLGCPIGCASLQSAGFFEKEMQIYIYLQVYLYIYIVYIYVSIHMIYICVYMYKYDYIMILIYPIATTMSCLSSWFWFVLVQLTIP